MLSCRGVSATEIKTRGKKWPLPSTWTTLWVFATSSCYVGDMPLFFFSRFFSGDGDNAENSSWISGWCQYQKHSLQSHWGVDVGDLGLCCPCTWKWSWRCRPLPEAEPFHGHWEVLFTCSSNLLWKTLAGRKGMVWRITQKGGVTDLKVWFKSHS